MKFLPQEKESAPPHTVLPSIRFNRLPKRSGIEGGENRQQRAYPGRR